MAPSRGAGLLLELLYLSLLPQLSAVATYPSEFRFSWCVGEKCFDHRISSAHFQLRVKGYYEENGRPPVREALFVATLPVVYQRELALGCPGLVVMAHLLLAEVRLYTHPVVEAEELVARVNAIMDMPELAGPHRDGVLQAWPYERAMSRYEQLKSRVMNARPLSLDIVIPHCKEDLSWIGDRSKLEVLPPKTRLFVYEKCGGSSAGDLVHIVEPQVQIINIGLEDAVDPRTGLFARRDECTAYLAHVARQYYDDQQGGGGLADMTLFLHGDPGDHTPMGLLNLLLRGLASGAMADIEFVHLGSPRMVYAANPCQDEIFEAAIGRPKKKPILTYCCSQFGVSRERILSRPYTDYVRMFQLVDGSTPDLCQRIGPSYEKYEGARLSHCFFFEYFWHVVFGEEEELPLRADSKGLPPALRLKDNEEDLPSIWHSYLGMYYGGQATFAKQGHEQWLRQITTPSGIAGPTQVNYGDLLMHEKH
eukprot:TRINITY_DN47380_c0_g1_i2.p1 TRINITY_DN47380_c0_g1~~TRINITY_DN47380_c0_g1_i2.p1  ORF type:complete len:479 (-),score=75.61 TRINITY_DN47380_c0_g1_i2:84-1520(-)